MTEIVAGKYVTNELSKKAMGGTEMMAQRMIKHIDPSLLADFQIIHSRVRELKPDLKRILVLHDLHNDPEVAKLTDPEYRKQFDKIVFVSNWQAQMYNVSLGIPYSEFVVIPNFIEPIEFKAREEGPIRLIYHTTPHRGLALLVPVFELLAKHHDVHLDVFSSFAAYGWDDRDKPYEPLFDRIRQHPNATYHGFQPNSVVREALQAADIFAYPCIWPETSCIALIEAMAAGAFAIHPNLAALPETACAGTLMYQFHEDPQEHAQRFFKPLIAAVGSMKKSRKEVTAVAEMSSSHYNHIYGSGSVVPKWTNLLKDLRDGKSGNR